MLRENVQTALEALPAYFRSETFIEGIDATDLFALNSSLGGTIEVQVVETLNAIRKVWDPNDEWLEYRFVRRAQSFPDVRLVSNATNLPPALGIELKGWYLLSKEGVPSFRYQVTPNVCSPYDLLVIVPWRLKNVLSGNPIAHPPYIESARYAAEMRNYWWEYVRQSKSDPTITQPAGAAPYPPPKSNVNDVPASDAGNNFGRIPRLKDSLPELARYIEATVREPAAGVESRHWITFFKSFTDDADADAVWAALQRQVGKQLGDRAEAIAERLEQLLSELGKYLPGEPPTT